MRWLLIALGLFSIFVITCSEQDQEATVHTFRNYNEDNVLIAETSGGPQYSDLLFTYYEIARVQQDESIPENLLAHPRWIGTDENGNIYVIDSTVRSKRRVVVYDQDGVFSHTIGQEGDGPGEFRSPEILSIRDGIIAIFDDSHQRLSYYSLDGTFIRSITHTFNTRWTISETI